MFKKHIFAFILLLLATVQAHAVLLDSLLRSIIDREFGNATFALVVKDPESDEILFDLNGNKNLTPASNTKLYPAAASLIALGKEYQFKTELGYSPKRRNKRTLKGNLYFKFSGDPSFKESNLQSMVHSLKKDGITKLTGNVIVDDRQFEPPHISPGMSYDDIGWYYAAATPAIIINENAFRVYFRANPRINKRIKLKPMEDTFGIKLVNKAITVGKDEAARHCDVSVRHQNKNTIRVSGCWPFNKKERVERLSVPDPFTWFENILRSKLKKENIRFTGRVVRGYWPKDLKPTHTHYSAQLKQLLKHMLYESDNLYADSLEKKLGYEYRRHGNFKEGAFAIKHILSSLAGVSVENLVLHDGAGTRYNMSSARQLVDLLSVVYKNDHIRDVFVDALPQSGVRGSLRERMSDPDLRGNIFAKTGTMHDMSSLAGYLLLPNQKPLIFAMITNHYNGKIEHLKRTEDSLIRIIWSSE